MRSTTQPTWPQSGAVLGLATSDQGLEPTLAEETAVLVVVVAAVCDDALGAAARTTRRTGDGRHSLEQRDQLGDVVAVAAGERPGKRDPTRGGASHCGPVIASVAPDGGATQDGALRDAGPLRPTPLP